MEIKRSRLRAVHAMLIVYVMLVAGFAAVLQSRGASADRTELVVGLQNDMTTLNFWNPETNTVWNNYQVGWNFETLFSTDPDSALYGILADDGVTGTHSGTKGYDIRTDLDATGKTVDVFVRQGVTFHNGQTMTADDIVFSFQAKAWSTEQTIITEPLWWPTPNPNVVHWSGTGGSHIGVTKVSATVVRFYMYKPFALFYQGTLGGVTIIPKAVWVGPPSHMNPNPQINITNPPNLVTDTADRSIDFAYGNNAADIPSTIGTGMFKLDSWTHNVGARISVYTGYWGQTKAILWNGVSYPYYPEKLRSIRFVIYTSLDVISLALQRGDIDTLIWTLTPGFLSQIKFNPTISVEQVTDRGFFYLSFNLRRKPWGDPTRQPATTAASLKLRQAISMAIDKNYIVNTLMGGFGSPGTVPISTHKSFYVNNSAAPPAFNLVAAAALLDSAGITDQNGDGFRDYIDGSPIKATILTPPKDYDPVRADAGIMISNNLKKIGLNIDAAPTSFDTIVSKAFTEVDFDIYVLGWLLGDFPELYLKDFFHGSSDSAINPAGSNSAGYHNTQVDTWIDTMLQTVDTATRVQIIKNIEGQVTNDIPWNVLYYRKNLNAFRNDRWEGWVNTPPQIYNFWSLSKLRPAGALTVAPPSGALNVALTVPERALAGHLVTVNAYVSQNLAPVNGATVYLNATIGVGTGATTRSMQGTTNVNGNATFSWTVPVIQGDLVLAATAWMGAATGVNSKIVEVTVGPPAPIAQLRVSTPTPVIGTGGTAALTATLTDGLGTGIAGHRVTIDRTLLLGTIAPAAAGSDTTNAAGVATFTYSAPPNANQFPNQHLTDIVKANTTVDETVATDTQAASIVIFVENDNAPDWRIVDIQGAPNPVLSLSVPGSNVAVQVKVTDFAGAARQGEVVEPVVPTGDTNVTVNPATVTTDAAGMGTFTLGHTAGAVQGNVVVRFRVHNRATQATDEIALLMSDAVTAGYGAVLDLTRRALTSAPTPDSSTVSATVYNQLGVPAPNAAAIFQISYSPLGLRGQFAWDYDYLTPLYSGVGLDMNSFGTGSLAPSFDSSTGQGTGWGVENFLEDWEVLGDTTNLAGTYLDSCDPTGAAHGTDPWPADFSGLYELNATGVTDVNGQITSTFSTVPQRTDDAVQVRAWIGSSTGANRLHVEADACNFVSFIRDANFVMDTGFVVKRAPVFGAGSITISRPLFSSASRTAQITGTFYKRGGVLLPNVQVFLVQGFGTAARNIHAGGAFGGTFTTNAAGVVAFNRTVALASLTQPLFFSFIPADPAWAYGGRDQLFRGDYGDYWFAPTFAVLLAKIPNEFTAGYLFVPSTTAFAVVSARSALLPPAGSTTATVRVTGGTGLPMANATVWSGPVSNITDANGIATLPFSATTLGANEQLVVVRTTDGQVLRAWYGVVVTYPVLAVQSVTVDPKQAGSASTITVNVQNTLAVAGPATVTISVDGTVVSAKVINIGASATQAVTFSYVFDSAKSYTVASADKSATANVPAAPAPPGPDLGVAIGLGVGLLIVGLVVGAGLGMVMKGRRKPPAEASSTESPMAEEEIRDSGDTEQR